MICLPLYVCLCLVSSFRGYVTGSFVKNYALYFPNKDVGTYANIWGMPSLTRFTICFWMKTKASNMGTPFSYNVAGGDNELLIYNYGDFRLAIGDKTRRVHGSANDGRWHHICFTWRSHDGAVRFYKDGRLRTHDLNGLKKGYTIKGGGSLVLGQEQDSPGGRFASYQSFQGYLTDVNVWSYVLSSTKIRKLSKSCLAGNGNVYKWNDFIYGVKGKTAIVMPLPCYPK